MLPGFAQSLAFPDVSQLWNNVPRCATIFTWLSPVPRHNGPQCPASLCVYFSFSKGTSKVALPPNSPMITWLTLWEVKPPSEVLDVTSLGGKRLKATHRILGMLPRTTLFLHRKQSINLEYSFYLSITFQSREKISMILIYRHCIGIYTHNSETFSALCVSPLYSGHWWQSSVSRYLPFEAGVPSPELMAYLNLKTHCTETPRLSLHSRNLGQMREPEWWQDRSHSDTEAKVLACQAKPWGKTFILLQTAARGLEG